MFVLGISPFHDSSVCLLNNGNIQLFLKEERFTKIKRDMHPYKSLLIVKDFVEKHNINIDIICIAAPTDSTLDSLLVFLNKFFNKPVEIYKEQHHLTHASLAFYNSGFDNSLVFVIDRNGSVINNMREAETVFYATYPCNFQTLHKNFWRSVTGDNEDYFDQAKQLKNKSYSYNIDSCMSIVKVYESATTIIGQQPLENGKTMGLASYGNKIVENLFVDNRPIDNKFTHGYYHFPDIGSTINVKHINKIIKDVPKDNYQFYADYAYTVQTQTQDVVLSMVKDWVEKTKIKNVCITGGYGMNVVANAHLVKNLPDVKFYFEPLADDSGNSIGVCYHYYRNKTKDETKKPITTTFIHGIKDDSVVNAIVTDARYVAQKLHAGKIVAVFNGLSESGPRALGNRSILFNPTIQNGKDIVNSVKNREWYRPFAGVILKEKFSEYFETLGLSDAEFMCVSFQSKTNKLPAITHVDGSCRVQTCDQTIPHLHLLLNEFNNITQIPVLLNTSFNLAGEPLVETKEDALRTFYNSKIDILWFPETNQVLEK